MSTTFVPPKPSDWEGPSTDTAKFTPPPVSAWEGPTNVPKPPLPYNPVQRGAKMKGTVETPALLKPMESGVNDVISGVDTLTEEGKKQGIMPSLPSSKSLGAVSKIARGTGQVVAPYAIAANPVGMAVGAAKGLPVQMAVEHGAKALGVPEGTAEFVSDVAGVAAGSHDFKVPGKIKSAIKAKVDTVDPAPTMVQALKPTANRTGFAATLQRSLPELKATEPELGKPIASIDDLLSAIDLAKKRVWAQYKGIAGPQAKSYADASPIADAMDASISDQLKFEQPGRAKQLQKEASIYRKPLTVEQLESFLKTTNAQLDTYYAKNPLARRIEAGKNPDTAALEAKADAIRDVLYKSLDGEGEGAAPRELKQRYGSLLEMERAAWPRRNVAARQQPNSLAEQVGKWHGYGQMAKGAVKAMTGNFMGGVADIAGGAADREMASFLKDQQLTDTLIRKAFGSFKGAPTPVAAPPQFQPKALIGTGDIITPPPADKSFVRSAPAMTQPPNARRALPQGGSAPIITPPPDDASFVRGVPGMNAPPFQRKGLPPARTIEIPPSSYSRSTGETLPPNTGAASDRSFVRGVNAQMDPETGQYLGEPTSPEALAELEAAYQNRRVRFPDLRAPGQVR